MAWIYDRNVVKLLQNHHHTRDGVRERKDGVRERKIEPKPVSNTHPNPVTSTPLGYNAQSAPKGEVEMKKVGMGRHRSLEEWANSTSRGWGDRGLAGDVHTVDNTNPWLDGMGWLQRF